MATIGLPFYNLPEPSSPEVIVKGGEYRVGNSVITNPAEEVAWAAQYLADALAALKQKELDEGDTLHLAGKRAWDAILAANCIYSGSASWEHLGREIQQKYIDVAKAVLEVVPDET